MATVTYKVIDAQWNPSDPAAAQTLLTGLGQQGWGLVTVYPDPIREKSRWVFSNPPPGAGGAATSSPPPSTANPLMSGIAAPGIAAQYSCGDHVHPSDTSRVARSGDTMTGNLSIVPGSGNAIFNLNSNSNSLQGSNVNLRWNLRLGDGSVESGGNTGSNLTISRYNDVGTLIDQPVTINRATGATTFADTVTAPTPTPGDNSTNVATTAFVIAALATLDVPASSSTLPLMDGAATVGTGTTYARADHVHPTDTSRAPTANPTFTGTVTLPTPTAGDNSTKGATTAFVGTAITDAAVPAPSSTTPLLEGTAAVGSSLTYARADHVHPAPAAPALRSYLAGLTLSTAGSSTTFSVAPGIACNSTNVDMLVLASAISKTTAAWTVGNGNGALDIGAIANSTWYHVHLIKRTDTGAVDALISLSPSAPTLPANYTEFRRIGSMLTNASGQWTSFTQLGDSFLWTAPVADVNGIATVVAATLKILTVPTGVQTIAEINGSITGATASSNALLFSSPDTGGLAAPGGAPARWSMVASAGTGGVGAGKDWVRTNTSGQIYVSAIAAGNTYFINTFGWSDRRGRDS